MMACCCPTILCGPCTALPDAANVSVTVSGFTGLACCSNYNTTFVMQFQSSGSCNVNGYLGGLGTPYCNNASGQAAVIVQFFLSGGTVWIRVHITSSTNGVSTAVYEVDTGVTSPVDCGGASLQDTWSPTFVSQTETDTCDGSAATVSVTISP